MQKVIFIPAAITSGFLALPSLAEDFWIKKTYLGWNDKEIQKMLNDSPWSKQDGSASTEPGARGEPRNRERIALGVAGWSARRRRSQRLGWRSMLEERGQSHGSTYPSIAACDETARAVDQRTAGQTSHRPAEIRQGGSLVRRGNAASGTRGIGLRSDSQRTPPALSQVDPAQLREALLNAASLNRKDSEAIRPSEVQVAETEDGGIVAVLVFPKADPITPDDKEVEFVTKLGSRGFRCKFVPREMIAGGRLQL